VRYHLARRTRAVIGDAGAIAHTELGVATNVARARGKLVTALLVEAAFLEHEHPERTSMLDRAARLRKAAQDVVPRFSDVVYASVDVDGVRYGWYRTTGTDTDELD
jgi:hypothetical protein